MSSALGSDLLLLLLLFIIHGALSQGAFPQLHDRLNHRAADVAAGENLPGLKQHDPFRRGHDSFLFFHLAAGLVESSVIPERSGRSKRDGHCRSNRTSETNTPSVRISALKRFNVARNEIGNHSRDKTGKTEVIVLT